MKRNTTILISGAPRSPQAKPHQTPGRADGPRHAARNAMRCRSGQRGCAHSPCRLDPDIRAGGSARGNCQRPTVRRTGALSHSRASPSPRETSSRSPQPAPQAAGQDSAASMPTAHPRAASTTRVRSAAETLPASPGHRPTSTASSAPSTRPPISAPPPTSGSASGRRRKLGQPVIETIRGAGHRLRTDRCPASPA